MEFGHKNQDKNELNSHIDLCAYCGNNILRGAMRCVSCGKILKTPEEQSAAIRTIEKSQNSFKFRKILKLIVFLVSSGTVYFFYSEEITAFIAKLLAK